MIIRLIFGLGLVDQLRILFKAEQPPVSLPATLYAQTEQMIHLKICNRHDQHEPPEIVRFSETIDQVDSGDSVRV